MDNCFRPALGPPEPIEEDAPKRRVTVRDYRRR